MKNIVLRSSSFTSTHKNVNHSSTISFFSTNSIKRAPIIDPPPGSPPIPGYPPSIPSLNPFSWYMNFLEQQARNSWKQLPDYFVRALQPHYPKANLANVHYAEAINTLHGSSITFENKIYFHRNLDIRKNSNDLWLLLHELEHVRQYSVHGGLIPFLTKYIIQGGIAIASNGSFKIHDHIELEKEANQKADRILQIAKRDIRIYSVLGFKERFQALHNYAMRQGYAAIFPNCHNADYGNGMVVGSIILDRDIVEWRDIPASQLGNPNSIERHFTAVHDYAVRNGFEAGLPNFHQADYGQGRVYGTYLIKKGAAEHRDILVAELGKPKTPEDRFKAVYGYAIRNGFEAGFPNFHHANYGHGEVYGTFLLRKPFATWRDIPAYDISEPYNEGITFSETMGPKGP